MPVPTLQAAEQPEEVAELLLASNDRHAEATHRSMSTFWLHNLTGEAVEFWASTQPPPGVKWLPETRGWGRLALPVALTAEADPQGEPADQVEVLGLAARHADSESWHLWQACSDPTPPGRPLGFNAVSLPAAH